MSQSEDLSWMMPDQAFEWIEENIPYGSKILEFGSGKGSNRLSTNYCLYSVEHDPLWISKFDTNYIYAPIRFFADTAEGKGIGWYDADIINANLPDGEFSLIIIDGPPKAIGRRGIMNHVSILNRTNHVLIDDLQRDEEFELSQEISRVIGLHCIHLGKCQTNGQERQFGVFERN